MNKTNLQLKEEVERLKSMISLLKNCKDHSIDYGQYGDGDDTYDSG